MSNHPPSARDHAWSAVALLGLVTILAYANSFSIPFVFDDKISIVENETIRAIFPLTGVLSPPTQSATAGRPLVNLSLAISYAFGGLAPGVFRAWNLGIHLLCGLLLFVLVRSTLDGAEPLPPQPGVTRGARRRRAPDTAVARSAPAPTRSTAIALACALVWLLHPLATEVVDYTTQRTESMMALCYLATLYTAARGMRARRPGPWYGAAILACGLGMLCKEAMATAPVMVLLYDAAFHAKGIRRALRSRFRLYTGLAVTWLILLALLLSGPRSDTAGFSAGTSPTTYLMNQGPMVFHYLRLAVWPSGLILDYGLPRDTGTAAALPALLLLGILLIAVVSAWSWWPALSFLGLWFFITLAPASSLIPIATEVGAERRMYLPLAAVVVLTVLGAERILPRRNLRLALLAVVCLSLGVVTVRRNAEYQDPVRLWQTVVERYPHGRAHFGLGVALREAGRTDDSIRELEIAARDFDDAVFPLAAALSSQGRHQEAEDHLRRYMTDELHDDSFVRAANQLGLALAADGQPAEAAAAFAEVLKRQPENIDGLAGAGSAWLRLGETEKAIAAYRDYVRLAPPSSAAFFNFGLALARAGQLHEAIAPLTRAAILEPNDPALHAILADTLLAVGRTDEAAAQYQIVAELDPRPDAHRRIDGILHNLTAHRDALLGRGSPPATGAGR